jgi:hypothetical protein
MIKKTANAMLKEPTMNVGEWERLYSKSMSKTASIHKIAADQTKYMLSHCTIMSSVMTEPDPMDYWIKPECSHLVNNNDDAWSNEVLKLSHKSFVGAFNFVEHFQNSAFAKGHILDAVLRKMNITEDTWVYFVDILVATDLAHTELINDIRSGKVKYLSMGCVTDLVICSFCGHHVTDNGNYCNHLAFQKGAFLTDENGVPRRVAELCGHKSMPNGGVKFVEASWVATPAFPGASKRNTIEGGDEWLGPKTPYTTAAAESKFAKAASQRPERQESEDLLAEMDEIASKLK